MKRESFKSPSIRKRKCERCGDRHVVRPRDERLCLTCDILTRAADGEEPGAIAARFGLPGFLVEELLYRNPQAR